MIPFGGGTSIEGQTLAVRGGVSLDFSRMRDVVELREGDLDITVQAGLGYVELNEMLKPRGLWFPLDPGYGDCFHLYLFHICHSNIQYLIHYSPGASVGGMCACRCSGSTALRYGSMRENVLNVTAVLPDGTIIRTGSRARKSSAGYDVTRLLIGSEGTLAVITEATLKLHPIPRYAYALKVCFPSVKEAALAATGAQRSGVTLGRAELMDDTMVNILNKSNPSDQSWPEKVTLLFEVTGSSTAATTEQMELLKQITRCNSGTDEVVLTDPEACRSIWLQRKQALWSIMGQYPDREAMITDACVPLSRLPELISASRALIDKSSLPCPLLAHAGDGNIHVIIMFHSENPQEYQEAKQLADAMSLHAIKLGGTCTGEHGIGTGKKNMLRLEMGEGTMKLMELIKKSIDPENIMNPDKIIDADRVDKK